VCGFPDTVEGSSGLGLILSEPICSRRNGFRGESHLVAVAPGVPKTKSTEADILTQCKFLMMHTHRTADIRLRKKDLGAVRSGKIGEAPAHIPSSAQQVSLESKNTRKSKSLPFEFKPKREPKMTSAVSETCNPDLGTAINLHRRVVAAARV
jgi:hypothetical protein